MSEPTLPEAGEPTDLVTLITNLTKEWEQYHLQDDDLWESFKENFEGYTENDFKIPSNIQIRKLRELLRKQGVWVLKNPKVSIARSLFKTLQEEVPTPWTEEEIEECKDKEVFTSRHIEHLIKTDYITTEQYTSSKFYGIMIDAGAAHVQFGIGSVSSIGSITVDTLVGLVEFHMVKADTLFLLSLTDMDRRGVG